MTLENLCHLFDQYEIVDKQFQIDKDYFSAIENIYTDGKVKTNISAEGYIHINSVKDATYIIYADRKYNICLCIYKYIFETKYKEIIDKLNVIRDLVKDMNSFTIIDKDDPTSINVDDDVIDINTFLCIECDSKENLIFNRSKTNPDILETKCNVCKTEYTFTPSKYYKLASKRTIYFKSEKSSRQIEIKTSKKETKPKTNETTTKEAKQ
jgi:hypothetical protein